MIALWRDHRRHQYVRAAQRSMEWFPKHLQYILDKQLSCDVTVKLQLSWALPVDHEGNGLTL